MPWHRYANPLHPFRDLGIHRYLLGQFVRRGIATGFADVV